MSALILSGFVFVSTLGGIFLGTLLRRSLPEHHLNRHAKDVVRLGAGLIATIAALVLDCSSEQRRGRSTRKRATLGRRRLHWRHQLSHHRRKRAVRAGREAARLLARDHRQSAARLAGRCPRRRSERRLATGVLQPAKCNVRPRRGGLRLFHASAARYLAAPGRRP